MLSLPFAKNTSPLSEHSLSVHVQHAGYQAHGIPSIQWYTDCILPPSSSLIVSSSFLLPLIFIPLSSSFLFFYSPLSFSTISLFCLRSLTLSSSSSTPPGIIYQHKCWLSSCWCYRVGGFFVCFFITLTRGTDTIDSPTGPRRSYVAFERIGKQMDFRGSILAAARSLNSNS